MDKLDQLKRPFRIELQVACFLALSLFWQQAPAQSPASETEPLREFRGVWVTTVFNIDFPSSPGLSPGALRTEWSDLLSRLKTRGLNALVVQVRPAGDAIYASELAPWSAWLTGRQGRPLENDFDPLPYMIRTAHENGFEFHAWINPYRLTTSPDTSSLDPRHLLRAKPEWTVRYGKGYYLNPGIPEVRQHVYRVVDELLRKYDIDALHLDDYFYPYPVMGEEFPDGPQFEAYGQPCQSPASWRRNNNNALIRGIAETIRNIRPAVQLGVSPFGVYRNETEALWGAPSQASVSSFHDLYADVLLWMKEGWIDYLAPQVYWSIGYPVADYARLADWWLRHRNKTNIYIGQAAYKVGNNSDLAWSDPSQIPRQVRLNRLLEACDGQIFFSAGKVLNDPLDLADSISHLFSGPALLPKFRTGEETVPAPPKLRRVKFGRDGTVRLHWKVRRKDRQQKPDYYAIYRLNGRSARKPHSGADLLAIGPLRGGGMSFIDSTVRTGGACTYFIVGLNRRHLESEPSNPRTILHRKGRWRHCRTLPSLEQILSAP